MHPSAWAGPPEPTLTDAVQAQLGTSWHPVHRLDRQTSGLTVFAEGSAAARAWQEALAGGEKRYLALVRGVFRGPVDIDHPLRDEDGTTRPARSRAEPVISRSDDAVRASLVRVQIFTGRTHQVRRHLKHLSHPVLGDANYGKGPLNRYYRDTFGLARLGLHARTLRVTEPLSNDRKHFVSPVEAGLSRVLDALFGEAWRAHLDALEALPQT